MGAQWAAHTPASLVQLGDEYQKTLSIQLAYRWGQPQLYYQIGPGLTGFSAGAVWDDFKVGIEHLGRWERAAVITDSDSIRFAVRAFGFLIPGGFRVFPLNAEAKAREWIQEGL